MKLDEIFGDYQLPPERTSHKHDFVHSKKSHVVTPASGPVIDIQRAVDKLESVERINDQERRKLFLLAKRIKALSGR